MPNTNKIAELNDLFRTARARQPEDVWNPMLSGGGHWFQTAGISALSSLDQRAIRRKVQEFNAFTDGDDPHGEHDFGAFDHNNHRIFWKIDYYDSTLCAGRMDWMQQNYPSFFGGYSRRDLRADIDKRLAIQLGVN